VSIGKRVTVFSVRVKCVQLKSIKFHSFLLHRFTLGNTNGLFLRRQIYKIQYFVAFNSFCHCLKQSFPLFVDVMLEIN